MKESNNNKTRSILLNTINRPTPEEALSLKEKDIIKTGNKIGYKFSHKIMNSIYDVHEALMPIMESGLISMMKDTEKKNPDYYIFARDGELIYDALWGIGQSKEKNLEKRVYYLKTSLGMNDDKNNSKYLNEIGITKSRFKKGKEMIFIDSGFEGSLFHKVGKWTRYNKDLPNSRMDGYLVDTSKSSTFNILNLHKLKLIEVENMTKKMKESPYMKHANGTINTIVCAFLQLMPKFTGRFVSTYYKNGYWDVMPEENTFIRENSIISNNHNQRTNSNQYNLIETIPYCINADIVNPVASLLLQKKTLDYFSNPNTQDRIYDKIKKS
ncbi:hypothetical protein KAS08_06015 [Candidatus Pacearchaeota archaeon]|nr:hypothetical protein [Candidatus Pacearchaeota archaeon]